METPMHPNVSRYKLYLFEAEKKYKKDCLHIEPRYSQWFTVVIGIVVLMGIIDVSIARADPTQFVPSVSQVGLITHPQIFLQKNEIPNYDLATLNFLAMEGLPETSPISHKAYQEILWKWVDMVHAETEKYFWKFRKNPDEYNYSEAYFRVLMLITVLEKDLHIQNNPELMSEPSLNDISTTKFFRYPKDLFLPGLIDNRLGTCASVPVLTASIGRMLGYPLKLVSCKGHLFVRWDDGKERFNIDSGGRGLQTYSDDHYKKWPFPLTEEELASGFFLKSMNPVEEYAVFLETRGICLLEHKEYARALEVFNHVQRLIPEHPYIKSFIDVAALKKLNVVLSRRMP
jgi:hypothetical protein